jgi:hypothetical protein
MTTASLAASQDKYYYNIQYSSADQLSVTFGHIGGSGSTGTNGSLDNLKGETEAIYKYFANLTMDDDFVKKGFVFDEGSTGSLSISPLKKPDGKRGEPGMYFIVAERARMKDRINKGTWTLQLSGSTIGEGDHASYGADEDNNRVSCSLSASVFSFTDDSAYNDGGATSTTVGPRYNIVSGSAGTRSSSNPVYGWFYPNLGLWAFRESVLSSSLRGRRAFVTETAVQSSSWGNGLAMDERINGSVDNSWKMVKALQLGTQTIRAEEDQTTTSYFCRARAHQFNGTNNPSFLSGSNGRLTNLDMEGSIQTYPTTVGLYDSFYNLVAVGRLSSPIQKNFKSEATIKVNLTF